jgi:hypothetical protein
MGLVIMRMNVDFRTESLLAYPKLSPSSPITLQQETFLDLAKTMLGPGSLPIAHSSPIPRMSQTAPTWHCRSKELEPLVQDQLQLVQIISLLSVLLLA